MAKRKHIKNKSGVIEGKHDQDDLFMQPWFIPLHIYNKLRSFLPPAHLFKMRYYFEDFGCLRCGRLDVLYGSNGLCQKCSVLIRGRLNVAVGKRLKQMGFGSPNVRTFSTFDNRMSEAEQVAKNILFPSR